jgi:hypothetical protein
MADFSVKKVTVVRNGNVIITIDHKGEEKFVQASQSTVDYYTKKGKRKMHFVRTIFNILFFVGQMKALIVRLLNEEENENSSNCSESDTEIVEKEPDKTSETNESKDRWTTDAIDDLIFYRLELEEAFQDITKKKPLLWQELEDNMKAKGHKIMTKKLKSK